MLLYRSPLPIILPAALQTWTIGCRQIHKISKKGYSLECFTVSFYNFLQQSVKIWLWGGRLGNRHQGIFFKLSNFLRSYVVRQIARQLVLSISGDII